MVPQKSYKAKMPMRIILMLTCVLAGQYTIVSWARDHRIHHKYTETDADPHNASRGFFYSHCGWNMMRRHPEYKEKRKVIDVNDLLQDPVIRFQQKYYTLLSLTIHIIFPTAVTYYVIGDTLFNSIIIGFFMRYTLSLNVIWCVNSVAHYWGYKPYNRNIMARQNFIMTYALIDKFWHNYHHTFPWDYRNTESSHPLQIPGHIIKACAWLGQTYDLKTASPELIQKVLAKNLPKNYEVAETGFTGKFDTTATKITAM